VVHIGDSTSDGLISPAYIPSRSQRIAGRYAAAGVKSVRTEISGARSIVETLPGQVNGYYTPAGYVARARLIAQALAKAFPEGGHSSGCVVR
jgi:hypothetical protein